MDQLGINSSPFSFQQSNLNMQAKPVIKIAEFIPEHIETRLMDANPGGELISDGLITVAPDIPGTFTGFSIMKNQWIGANQHELYFMVRLPAAAVEYQELFLGDIRHQTHGYSQVIHEEIATIPQVTISSDIAGTISVEKTATAGQPWIELRIIRTFIQRAIDFTIEAGVEINQAHIPLYVGQTFGHRGQNIPFSDMRINAWDSFNLSSLIVPAGKYTIDQYRKFIDYHDGLTEGTGSENPLKVYFVDAQFVV